MMNKRKPYPAPLSTSDTRFFYDHAVWGYNSATETAAEGRLRGAHALASAERTARKLGWFCEWVDDPNADNSWMDAEERVQPHEAYGCILYRICAACGQREQLASLWGIYDTDANYRRVVEAELAQEAIHEQAAGSAS
jgi:hypothetical protein